MRRLVSIFLAASWSVLAVQADTGGFPGTGDKAQWLKANGFFAEGNTLSGAKKYGEAAAKYQQAIDVYPSDYHYHFNLALALKRKGETREALQAFQRAVELNGDDWKSWKGLANCHFKLGELKEAKVAFERALRCNPPGKEAVELRKGLSFCSRSG